MSEISPVEPVSEYTSLRSESERKRLERIPEPVEQVESPLVKSAAAQQDQKTTIQGFAYTGKGSFIDGVF
ncbi:MAG: hypothetical protein V3571_00960 [Pseudodesulfovibrio sp.]